jgi:predicted HTH domain antitoxin
MMSIATIAYPEEVRLALNLSADAFTDEIRMAAAAKLYELGRLSSGRAAELAGISRVRFLHELHRYGVPAINLSDDELRQDISHAAL